MYVPINDSHTVGYLLLSTLATLMINGLIFFVGFELIIFWSCLGSSFYYYVYPGVIDIPLFLLLIILFCFHPLFMLPSFIASCSYAKTNSKGFFVLSLFMNIINLIYQGAISIFYLIPWTMQYIQMINK